MTVSDIALAAVVGAVASLLANAVWSYVTSPKLVIGAPRETSTEGQAHSWGVRVAMADAMLFARHPALSVRASLRIREPATGSVKTFVCRWQGTPQPVVATAPNAYVPSIPLTGC